MTYIILAILFVLYKEWEQKKKSEKFWKDWEENSFEWNGFRLSKDSYEVVGGELRGK